MKSYFMVAKPASRFVSNGNQMGQILERHICTFSIQLYHGYAVGSYSNEHPQYAFYGTNKLKFPMTPNQLNTGRISTA